MRPMWDFSELVTDGRTHKSSYRVARPYLKTDKGTKSKKQKPRKKGVSH